jgi:hypothetical protein
MLQTSYNLYQKKLNEILIQLSSNTIKYGMFGLCLGADTYDRLDKFCIKNNIAKATLVRSLVQKYLDQVEDK